jgi:hypothetical protein
MFNKNPVLNKVSLCFEFWVLFIIGQHYHDAIQAHGMGYVIHLWMCFL